MCRQHVSLCGQSLGRGPTPCMCGVRVRVRVRVGIGSEHSAGGTPAALPPACATGSQSLGHRPPHKPLIRPPPLCVAGLLYRCSQSLGHRPTPRAVDPRASRRRYAGCPSASPPACTHALTVKTLLVVRVRSSEALDPTTPQRMQRRAHTHTHLRPCTCEGPGLGPGLPHSAVYSQSPHHARTRTPAPSAPPPPLQLR